ncbi:Protein of unknown function [Pyronema omphalodes CBS 100304]|uniref:Uncharacterized protein n=1 Tax=Pyronema omphalodes (strain CBS 100304) TaxID=1076935 RepID=U4L120_PYROM|nr:Protein of unknown function [Pyronema omphalodes CBS 100304]
MSNSNEPPFLPGGDEIYDGEDLNAKQVAKDARALLSSVETLINTGQVEPKRQVGDMKSANSTMTTRRSRRALRKQLMVSKEQLNAIDENSTPRIQALAGSREFWETLRITIWLLDNAEYQSSFTDIHLTTIDMCMKTVQRTMNEVGEECKFIIRTSTAQ